MIDELDFLEAVEAVDDAVEVVDENGDIYVIELEPPSRDAPFGFGAFLFLLSPAYWNEWRWEKAKRRRRRQEDRLMRKLEG